MRLEGSLHITRKSAVEMDVEGSIDLSGSKGHHVIKAKQQITPYEATPQLGWSRDTFHYIVLQGIALHSTTPH